MSTRRVTLQPSGHQFEVEAGEAILAAALRQHFVLPYGCRNGACGSCNFPDLSGHQVYACGVPVMVDAAQRDFTMQCRLPEDEFLADSFTTAADLAAG